MTAAQIYVHRGLHAGGAAHARQGPSCCFGGRSSGRKELMQGFVTMLAGVFSACVVVLHSF